MAEYPGTFQQDHENPFSFSRSRDEGTCLLLSMFHSITTICCASEAWNHCLTTRCCHTIQQILIPPTLIPTVSIQQILIPPTLIPTVLIQQILIPPTLIPTVSIQQILIPPTLIPTVLIHVSLVHSFLIGLIQYALSV